MEKIEKVLAAGNTHATVNRDPKAPARRVWRL